MSDPLDRLRAADPLGGRLPGPLPEMPLAGERRAPSRRRTTFLVAANVALVATVLLHGADHWLVQDRGIGQVSFEVILGGVAITAVAAFSLAAAWRGHRRAPHVAVAAGPWVAAAVIVGHFVPHWGEFSDPYAEAGVGAVSYAAALAVVAAGVAVGVAALHAALRRAY